MQFVRCVKKCRMAGQATDDSTVQRMHFACQVTKATDTHSEFITLCCFSMITVGTRTCACQVTKATDTHSEFITLCCFSMITVGTRTCINVVLYVRCLSCPSESGTLSLLYFCVVPDAVVLCMACHPKLMWYRTLQSGRLCLLRGDGQQSHSAAHIFVFKKLCKG